MHACIINHLLAYIHTYIHTYIYACTHIYAYTHTHTHTQYTRPKHRKKMEIHFEVIDCLVCTLRLYISYSHIYSVYICIHVFILSL